MLKKIKTLFIGLIVAATVTVSAPQKSRAFLPLYIIALLHADTLEDVFILNFTCLLVLPLCILEEESDGNSTTAEALRVQGYNASEIEDIVIGQGAVLAYINDLKKNQPELEKARIDLSAVPGMTTGYYQFAEENF